MLLDCFVEGSIRKSDVVPRSFSHRDEKDDPEIVLLAIHDEDGSSQSPSDIVDPGHPSPLFEAHQ